MESSSSLLPRHATVGTTAPDPLRQASSNGRKPRRRRPAPTARSKPPSQDRLVVVFVAASAVFSLISISPFLFGDFPTPHTGGADERGWLHKHGDGKGGVLNLAGNKTLLAWHYLVGQQKQQQEAEEGKVPRSGRPKSTGSDRESLPLARGVAGLPLSKTPALIGAKHGSIRCPSASAPADGNDQNEVYVDGLAYWNEPQGEMDVSFVSPFAPPQQSKEKRYVTFEPDRCVRLCLYGTSFVSVSSWL